MGSNISRTSAEHEDTLHKNNLKRDHEMRISSSICTQMRLLDDVIDPHYAWTPLGELTALPRPP